MKWDVAKQISKKQIERFPEINPTVLQLLVNRGLKTQEQIDEFLQPDYVKDIHDPYLFKDMKKAVQRVIAAGKNKERIYIFGDYDVDGVTGSAIMADIFKDLGYDFKSYIPDRHKEGYGLNLKALEKIAADKANLIITVDCGISNFTEIKLAKDKYGIDVIIVDHHDIPDNVPPAIAIIHSRMPKESYPFKKLSGGGTAFKFMQALLRSPELKLSDEQIEAKEKWLLDLVALSTVGDIMPIVGENRTLVKYGLVVLQKTRRLGLQKLYEGAGIDPKKINTQVIGWQINPRINAAGRLKHADLAYQLLTTDNIEQAIMMAHMLIKSNVARQKITEESFNQAVEQIDKEYKDKIPLSILVVFNEKWPPGILGLLAGKLVRKYSRPVYAVGKVDGNYVGSGRGIKGFHVTKALQGQSKLLIKFGGHSGACGFSLKSKNYNKFLLGLSEYSTKELKGVELELTIDIDAEIKFKDFDWELFELIKQFEPFGEANPEPNFLIKDLVVKDWRTVGTDNQHLRLYLQQGDVIKKAIAFGLGDWAKDLKLEAKVDIVCRIGINEWNGNRELQMTVQDMRIVNS